MFFLETGSGYFPIPDPHPGVKKAPDPRVVDPDPRETKLIKIRTKATTCQTKEVGTNKQKGLQICISKEMLM